MSACVNRCVQNCPRQPSNAGEERWPSKNYCVFNSSYIKTARLLDQTLVNNIQLTCQTTSIVILEGAARMCGWAWAIKESRSARAMRKAIKIGGSHAARQMLHLLASFGRKIGLKGSSMMLRKSTIAALSILVAVATAHPYNSEWNNAARYRWNDLFAARGQDVGARVMSQASVELSSCALVTETTTDARVRICSADKEGMSLHVAAASLHAARLNKIYKSAITYPRRTLSKSNCTCI